MVHVRCARRTCLSISLFHSRTRTKNFPIGSMGCGSIQLWIWPVSTWYTYGQWFSHNAPRCAQLKNCGAVDQILCMAWSKLPSLCQGGACCAEVQAGASQATLELKGPQPKQVVKRPSHVAHLWLPGHWKLVCAPGALAMEMALPLPQWPCWTWFGI